VYQISRTALDMILKEQHFDRTANLVRLACDERKPVKVYCFWNRARWTWNVMFYTVGHPMLSAYWKNHTLEISSETLFHDLEREIADEAAHPKERYGVECYDPEMGSCGYNASSIDEARKMIEEDAKKNDLYGEMVYEILGHMGDEIRTVARWTSGKWE